MSTIDARVVVVDERRSERQWAQQALSGLVRLETCESAEAALSVLGREAVDVLVSGVPEPADGALRLSERVRREHPATDVILLLNAPPEAADGTPLVDVLVCPASQGQLRRIVEQALLRRRLGVDNGRLARRLQTIERCRLLMPCLDPGEVYSTVLNLLLDVLDRRRGIALFRRTSPLGGALTLRGFSEDEASRLHSVLLEEKSVDPARFEGVECVEEGPLHVLLRDAGVQLRSFLAVPVRGDGAEAAIVWIFDDGQPFDAADAEQAAVVADYAGTALRNAERYHNAQERAFIDDVTEVYNVRYLLKTTENEIRRADRSENPLSMLFLDLDRFKLVNDRYGHLVGSQTLRSLSQLLLQCVRQVDTLARYGGDEFTILLVDTAHAAAMTIAERIRRTVEDNVFEAGREGPLRLTISIGVSTCPEHAVESDTLLDSADKAMYRSKSLGRNRVCSASEL